MIPEYFLRLACRVFGHSVVQHEVIGMVFPICKRCGKINYAWRVAQ